MTFCIVINISRKQNIVQDLNWAFDREKRDKTKEQKWKLLACGFYMLLNFVGWLSMNKYIFIDNFRSV